VPEPRLANSLLRRTFAQMHLGSKDYVHHCSTIFIGFLDAGFGAMVAQSIDRTLARYGRNLSHVEREASFETKEPE
jgi:hypothetical protein